MDDGRPTRRGRAGTEEGGRAALEGESRADVRSATSGKLGGTGGSNRRARPRRLPSRRRDGADRDGLGRLHRRQAVVGRRAAVDAPAERILSRQTTGGRVEG